MFTGIITESGTIKNIISRNNLKRLQIKAKTVKKGLKVGASVCVNGVCLTVVNIKWDYFEVEAVEATLQTTNLGRLQVGDSVNLEPALAVNGRLDGHIVTGHVDGVGLVIKRKKVGDQEEFYIKVPPQFLNFIVEKGSIGIDGISLTVAKIRKNIIKVVIIPHTLKHTTLCHKAISQTVNIELDILSKYAVNRMDNLVNPSTESQLEAKFLEFSNFVYRGSLN